MFYVLENLLRRLFFQILIGGGQHELDAVQLVDFAGTGVIVDGHDVGQRVLVPQLLDDAFSHHMVG